MASIHDDIQEILPGKGNAEFGGFRDDYRIIEHVRHAAFPDSFENEEFLFGHKHRDTDEVSDTIPSWGRKSISAIDYFPIDYFINNALFPYNP